MSDVFCMTNPHRLDGFILAAQRVLSSQGVDVGGKWFGEMLNARPDLSRLVWARGQYFSLPCLAFVDAIKVLHGVDVISAYHRAVRGMPGEV